MVLSLLGAGPTAARAEVAAPLRLGWNAAADPAVRGYAIYYGVVGQTGAVRVDAGASTSCSLSGLTVGVLYWIQAVSYDAAGVESVPSNQVKFTPITPALSPADGQLRVSLARQGDGRMQLRSTATPGQVCGIQFTPSLNPPQWQTLTNVTANSLGEVIALDSSAVQVAQRFYRAASVPLPLLSAIRILGLPSRQVRLDWTAPPFTQCRVLRANRPNASSWTTMAYVTADAEGRASYIDSPGPNVKTRFYRVATP